VERKVVGNCVFHSVMMDGGGQLFEVGVDAVPFKDLRQNGIALLLVAANNLANGLILVLVICGLDVPSSNTDGGIACKASKYSWTNPTVAINEIGTRTPIPWTTMRPARAHTPRADKKSRFSERHAYPIARPTYAHRNPPERR
jgi:hypothetical protein